MKNIKKKLIVVLTIYIVIAGMLISCNKENELIFGVNQNSATLNQKNEQTAEIEIINSVIQQYSKVIAIALDDLEFRTCVKKLALEQFDGDYDILVSKLHMSNFLNNSTSISIFLEEIVNTTFSEEFGMTGNEFIEKVVETIPNLQIAVPVKCEEWNPSTFIPRVVPIYLNFDEKNSQSIETFDSEWVMSTVSLEQDPNIPFVVIGVSERVGVKGDLLYANRTFKGNEGNTQSPSTPTNLIINYGNNSNELLLEWPDVDNEFGYQIYRYTQGESNSLIATTSVNTNFYIDNTVEANKRYTYMVRSVDSQGNPSGFSSSVSWYGSDRIPGNTLTLWKMKFDSSSDLKEYERWIRGRPELVLRVYSGLGINSSAEIRYINWIEPQPKRDEIYEDWWVCNIDIDSWYPETKGQIWTFSWSEKDNFETKQITLTPSATYKDSSGRFQIGVSPSVTFNITKHNDMGHIAVNYWDEKNKEYNLGSGFRFQFKN